MSKTHGKIELASLPQEVIEHIKQLERMRSDFVANVSHELRTPLTVIRGYLEIISEKEANQFTEASYKKIFEQMYQHSIRMENIIDELLLLARLETEEKPQNERKRLNITNILESLCAAAERVSGEQKHQIHLQSDPTLFLQGSENELKSLFSNLIINAVKYTPAKGRIVIKWFRKGQHAYFSVTDTGIGIAARHIPRVTERFYRVDKARSRESGGTGLGLAIAKHVLMRHDGNLIIESKLKEGSTFTCQFPFERINE